MLEDLLIFTAGIVCGIAIHSIIVLVSKLCDKHIKK